MCLPKSKSEMYMVFDNLSSLLLNCGVSICTQLISVFSSCFDISIFKFIVSLSLLIYVVGVMGLLYFDFQQDPLLGSPVVFCLSDIGYLAPTILRNCTMN